MHRRSRTGRLSPGDPGGAWIEACFSSVEVQPPDEAAALAILAGVKQRYEQFHNVLYTDEALQYAVYHSQRYIQGRCLPGKAIDLIDEAGAAASMRTGAGPEEVMEAEKRLKFIVATVGKCHCQPRIPKGEVL